MLKITNNEITIIQGNTGYLTVSMEDYTYTTGDKLVLTVRKEIDNNTKVIEKVIDANANFIFEPADTKTLDCGKYVYDIQLQTTYDELFTLFEPSPFYIMKGVSRDGKQ